ncbi:MAG: SUF system Fe-S cluster assembly regulator [Acidobacteriota bacterium]|jgi:FeS assembly SUF system regulator
MIRMTRLTDYGIVLLTRMARGGTGTVHNARDLAGAVGLPLPTVNKILKTLTRKGLLESHRGVKGGYGLARMPEEISILEVIDATEGPVAITDCSSEGEGCEHEEMCPLDGSWRRINDVIRRALEGITLAEMARPAPVGGEVARLRRHREDATTPC